jgi:hypothetical protein
MRQGAARRPRPGQAGPVQGMARRKPSAVTAAPVVGEAAGAGLACEARPSGPPAAQPTSSRSKPISRSSADDNVRLPYEVHGLERRGGAAEARALSLT